MITREEAKEKLLGDCKIIMHYTWSEDRQKVDIPHWYLSDSRTLKLINDIYDSLEQRINDAESKYYKAEDDKAHMGNTIEGLRIESQLSSNPLQLTCDQCKYLKPETCDDYEQCKFDDVCIRWEANLKTDHFQLKDTK